MKVKIGDIIYDGEDQMVMVILSDKDKYNIAHMAPEAHSYAAAPEGTPWTDLVDWMVYSDVGTVGDAAIIAQGGITGGGDDREN